VLAVNLTAPLHLTGALLQAGKIAPGGSLVFVSSLSRLLSYPGAAVYAASKDGLASYARSLAVALAPQKMHVLTVYPGPTRTAHARRYSPDNSREARRGSRRRLWPWWWLALCSVVSLCWCRVWATKFSPSSGAGSRPWAKLPCARRCGKSCGDKKQERG